MPIKITATNKALKQMEKLPENIKNRINELLDVLKNVPIPVKVYDVKKIKGREHTYRIRIGNYRVVYLFEKEKKEITILLILKRGKVYKKM